MVVPEQPRAGVLVVRLWVEPDRYGLRARIVEVSDLQTGDAISRAAADVGQILPMVEDFLSRFMRDAGVTVS
jgi:hypothetical protein